MQSVIMLGRLTRDVEGGQKGDTAYARFGIAVDRKYKREGQPTADFFNCTVFGKRAEFVQKYFTKGMKIIIRGTIQNDEYTNKDGEKVKTTTIIVEDADFVESKAASRANQQAQAQTPTPQQQAPVQSNDGFMNIPNGIAEDLPFT